MTLKQRPHPLVFKVNVVNITVYKTLHIRSNFLIPRFVLQENENDLALSNMQEYLSWIVL